MSSLWSVASWSVREDFSSLERERPFVTQPVEPKSDTAGGLLKDIRVSCPC